MDKQKQPKRLIQISPEYIQYIINKHNEIKKGTIKKESLSKLDQKLIDKHLPLLKEQLKNHHINNLITKINVIKTKEPVETPQ